MPIIPAITVSQSALAPNLITVNDTSTGSDVAITSRRIYFQTSQGTYLVEIGTTTDYEIWSYADSSETFDVLTEDSALSIVVQWLNISNTILYTYTQVYPFSEYNKQFAVYLGDLQATTPGILQDVNYATNMAIFWMYIVYAINMVEIAADISSSQNLFNKGTYMRQNESLFF